MKESICADSFGCDQILVLRLDAFLSFVRSGGVSSAATSVFSQHSNHSALHLHHGGGHHDGRHGGVGRLQANLVALNVDSFQGGIPCIHQLDHDLAIAGDIRLLHQNIVAIHNVLVLHALSLHLQHVHVFGAGAVGN